MCSGHEICDSVFFFVLLPIEIFRSPINVSSSYEQKHTKCRFCPILTKTEERREIYLNFLVKHFSNMWSGIQISCLISVILTDFHEFSQSVQVNAGIFLQLGHNHCLAFDFNFIIHLIISVLDFIWYEVWTALLNKS